MKLMVVVVVMWLILVTEPFCSSAVPADEAIHELDMSILCDSLEIDGKYNLEFEDSRSYSIWGSRAPIPINFKNLHIETDSIFIGNQLLDSLGETIRIEAQEPTAQLYIYREPNIPVHDIYISKIRTSSENAKIEFSTILGEPYVSFGKNSIIHLEKKYSNTEGWILKIEGRFQVIGDKDYEVMENERVGFSGSLQIESPKMPNSNNLRLYFDFSEHVKEFILNKGYIFFRSGYDSPPNNFMVESNGIIARNEVIEDGFRIDMTKEFYQDDRFLREFYLENICEMKVHNINVAENKLSVKSHIEYVGETCFPKIEVTTKYFLMTKDNTVGDLLVEISSLETDKKETVVFLDGRNYMIEVCVEKFVNDDIIIDFTHENFQKNITERDITVGFPYKHRFTCHIPSFKKQPIECYTEASYQKRSKESPEFSCKTESFYAEIQSEITFKIDNIDEIPKKIKENEKLLISRKITLESEISDSVEILVFLDVGEGFKIESSKYYPRSYSQKGDSSIMEFELRAPIIGVEKRDYEIKIFVLYKLNESNDYSIYLPKSTMEATIVENIIVEKGFRSYLSEWIPKAVSSIISAILSVSLQYKYLSGSRLEEGIRDFLRNFVKNEIQIDILIYVIRSLFIIAAFIFFMVIIAGVFYIL